MREKCCPAQLTALAELDRLLSTSSLVLSTRLASGSLLLLDNTRWFHGRSAVRDRGRWLKRIRFNECPEHLEAGAPALQRLVSRTESLQQEGRALQLQQQQQQRVAGEDELFLQLDRQNCRDRNEPGEDFMS